MSEPNSGVPNESANGDSGVPSSEPAAPESVELDLDKEKLEAWDEIKSDYQVEPDGDPVPKGMDAADSTPVDDAPESPHD